MVEAAVVLVVVVVVFAIWGRAPFNRWRMAKVRTLVQWGPKPLRPYHITLTPRLGFSVPWLRGGRMRWAPHHGLQLVEWHKGGRWVVSKQLLGKSKVIADTRRRRGD